MRLTCLTLAAALLATTLAALGAEASAKAAQRGPAPGGTNLPAEVLSLACAPSLVYEAPPTPLRITGGQDSFARRTFAPGDLITLNGGTDHGIDVGQEYYVRRVVPTDLGSIGRANPATIRTAGWIRVYAVDRQMSLATISHACDAIGVDDFLEPFVLPLVPAVSAEVLPAQRDNYGRVLVGNDRRRSFGRGEYFIVDRGSDHGVLVGSHFVVYRDNRRTGNFLFELGEAVAVDVRPESSTLQATLTRDAFIAGDWVALRK
jgi:hypothetical protein